MIDATKHLFVQILVEDEKTKEKYLVSYDSQNMSKKITKVEFGFFNGNKTFDLLKDSIKDLPDEITREISDYSIHPNSREFPRFTSDSPYTIVKAFKPSERPTVQEYTEKFLDLFIENYKDFHGTVNKEKYILLGALNKSQLKSHSLGDYPLSTSHTFGFSAYHDGSVPSDTELEFSVDNDSSFMNYLSDFLEVLNFLKGVSSEKELEIDYRDKLFELKEKYPYWII